MSEPAAHVGGGDLDRTIMPTLAEEQLTRESLPIVHDVAKRVQRSLAGHVSLDDLLSLGQFALVELVRRYEPERAPLAAYLRPRLRWAMLDGLRRYAQDSQLEARARALSASDAIAAERAAEPASEPAALSEEEHRNGLRDLLFEHAAAMGIALLSSGQGVVAKNDSGDDPEKSALKLALTRRLQKAIALLEERQRLIVERVYFQGEGLDEIGAALGITKSAVSRVHTTALQQLAKMLRREDL